MIRRLLKKIFQKIGIVKKPLKSQIIKLGGKLGDNIFIGSGTLIDLDFAFLLEIGNGVVIASNSIIELHDSSLPNVLGNEKLRVGKVIIKDNAYVGVATTILAGVTIGKGALIGANSLVNKSVPNGEVWAGVPIKYICKVSELVKKRNLDKNPLCYDVDWIGEAQKANLDYPKYKKKMQEKVKLYFERKDENIKC